MIYGTGPRVVLAPAFGARAERGPIRHLEMETVHVIPGDHFEKAVDRFFGEVTEVCASAQDGATLQRLIVHLHEERADRETASWRQLEAMLGYDPDEAPEGLITEMSSLERDLGSEGVQEAALSAPGENSAEILERAVSASEHSDVSVSVDIAEAIDRSIFVQDMPAWRWGEQAAEQVRHLLKVNTDAFGPDAFSELLDASWRDVAKAEALARRLPYGASLRTSRKTTKLALATRSNFDRRFEVARSIGDAIWNRGEVLGVISRAKTERQKFQRGFAQALLCPFSALRQYIDLEAPTDEQIDHAARKFQVHRNVVETLLVNKNVLPRETLLERLEAA
jgi:hypothetical protein